MADTGSKIKLHTMNIRDIIRETALGYVFWSIYPSVCAMIWFYPLNELEVTGYEAFALVKLSPMILGLGPLSRLLSNRWLMAVMRLGAVGCLASFQAPTTLERLIILCVGCFLIQLIFTLTLWSSSQKQRSASFWGFILGYFAYLSSRIWFTTFIPTWWNNSTNSIVIGISVIATLDKIASGQDGNKLIPVRKTGPSSVITAIGLSALLHLTHSVFGEVSLVTRWVVTGYPDPGPMPNPWGAVILVALFVGIWVPRRWSSSIVWWLVGAVSFLVLLYVRSWPGFIGGVVLAVYTTSLWPPMLELAVRCPPARTMFLTGLLHILHLLFGVWTVAYNFVPGGEYTREHTDWQVWSIVLSLGLATVAGRKHLSESLISHIRVHGVRMPNKKTMSALLLIVLVGLAGFVARQDPHRHEAPAKDSPEADFTAAIWTYHFGYDNQGWPSVVQSVDLLNSTGADVITLLESDASKPVLGNHDLGMFLGERLGMYVDFGVSTKDHTWGTLLLSRYPIVKSTHHMLPSPHGELAPAITATVNMTGHLVDFVVTHMGNDRDVVDRDLQAKFLARELREAKNPVVFLGYVTSAPGSRDYRQLTTKGNVHDIDSSDGDRWCEYIMYRGLIRLGYARVSHGGLSDTEVQFARFRFPQDPENFKDHKRVVHGHNKAPEGVRFNSKFGDYKEGHNWVTNHRYHMSTPKYFLP